MEQFVVILRNGVLNGWSLFSLDQQKRAERDEEDRQEGHEELERTAGSRQSRSEADRQEC